MSLGLPTIRPHVQSNTLVGVDGDGEYGVISRLDNGLNTTQLDKVGSSSHPLQYSEEHWVEQQEKIKMASTRNMQGLYMPMKIAMEQFAARQVGRLPCMATKKSNLMLDTLSGTDDMLCVEDILNNPLEYPERTGNMHAMMENKHGLF